MTQAGPSTRRAGGGSVNTQAPAPPSSPPTGTRTAWARAGAVRVRCARTRTRTLGVWALENGASPNALVGPEVWGAWSPDAATRQARVPCPALKAARPGSVLTDLPAARRVFPARVHGTCCAPGTAGDGEAPRRRAGGGRGCRALSPSSAWRPPGLCATSRSLGSWRGGQGLILAARSSEIMLHC